MNPAYKHLETKLKIAELTLQQWGGVILGIGLAIGWGLYLSPLGSSLTLFTSIYLGGIPILLAFLSSQAEFDLWLHAQALIHWRQGGDRYAPGPGASAFGYVLTEEPGDERERLRDQGPELDFAALWE